MGFSGEQIVLRNQKDKPARLQHTHTTTKGGLMVKTWFFIGKPSGPSPMENQKIENVKTVDSRNQIAGIGSRTHFLSKKSSPDQKPTGGCKIRYFDGKHTNTNTPTNTHFGKRLSRKSK